MIHSTAYVDKTAEVAADAEIGQMAYVGPRCIIHSGVKVGAKATVEVDTEVGEGTYVYPNAHIGGDPQDVSYRGEPSKLIIGKRNKIREFVTMHRATNKEDGTTVVGDDNLFMAYVCISHDCKIGSRTIMANCATLAGHVHVADDAVISGLIGIHQFVHIGELAMVAALSRISKDVPPYCTVLHNNIVSMNTIGLRRHGVDEHARAELKKAFEIFIDKNILVKDLPSRFAELEQTREVKVFSDFVTQSKRSVIRNFGRPLDL
ncbi:acyl-ACP--UDP-N-acetylglucosamine O-acyltransferase [Deferribacterales bacterium RsTz2092]|nr:acyl-[acyl-carrier-protein]--UDP-N-acetylglucosamine O-acyltransferase [Deferribacterales bacterium]